MGLTNPASNWTVFTNNSKVKALETSLNQSFRNFEELLLDLQQLHIDSENYKLQYLLVKQKCIDKNCEGVEDLKKIVATKDNIIQAVASTLTKLNETKDFSILSDAFKILFKEVTTLTPPTEDPSLRTSPSGNSNKADSPVYENTIPCDEDTSVTEDVSYTEDSLNEIESTPTGRKSPILQTRKAKNGLTKTDVRDKKKCPDDWPTPERKAVKLIFPSSRSTPKAGRKPRQTRLKLATMKTSMVVDLTCSPDVQQKQKQLVQPLIKKESIEEDTILPSPTSGPANSDLFKSISKPSPSKFKRPNPLSLKSRCEKVKQEQDVNKDTSNNVAIDMDVSVNILNQFANKLRDIKKENSVQKESSVIKENRSNPIKKAQETVVKKETEPVKMDVTDEDATNASISIQDMEAIEQLENDLNNINVLPSPLSRPLAENKNILNTPPMNEPESSISILRPESKRAVEAVKRKIPELLEPVYKEPAVRKKSEKKNLQGWSCEGCMNFYGVLYKDDPVMLSKKVQECSKHRGRHNPVRPKTPPNFWNPRWTVPDDTEELNRMNNAS